MININGTKADPNTVQCFEGNNNLVTAIRVLELASKLGIAVKERDSGVNWVTFEIQGKPLSTVSFFQPSHAYAFLLGVASVLTANQ